MSRIIGMVSEDRRRYLCSQSTSKAEVPSSIFTVALAPLSEGPALAGPNEPTTTVPSPSEAGPSEAGPNGINHYALYVIKFYFFYLDHTNDLFIIVSSQSSSIVR